MYYALAFKFTEKDPSFLCGISQCFCPGKGARQGLQNKGQIGKVSFLFSYYIQTPRTPFTMGSTWRHSLQKITLIIGCWHVSRRELAIGRWETGARLSIGQIQKREYPWRGGEGGTQSNYHHQEQLQQYWSWAPGCSQTGNSFCAKFMLTS